MKEIAESFRRHRFLFTELVKRDFKKKYKRTYLGMLWSVLSPLLTLLVMRIVFTTFFGSSIEHYTIYLFCGNIVWAYFSEATNGGMSALMDNSSIFSKINVPKYLFLFSRNVSALINFSMTFVVFLIFCLIDGVTITPYFLALLYPILCLVIFNVGIGLILSAMFIFFRDVQYLWSVFLTLLMYLSAIFYNPAQFGAFERVFLLNPVYVYIKYFRHVVIGVNGVAPGLPSVQYHLLALGYAVVAFAIGALIYKKMNHKFLYYV
ncbi:MAG: ABC transporter permease [Clostridia bacterium]|nr:ABC transporter permease [Clostridia bacterium]